MMLMLAVSAPALAPSIARAQTRNGDITAEAELDRQRCYVGDTVRFTIEVTGSTDAEPPRFVTQPVGAHLEFLGGSPSSKYSMIIIHGRRQETSSERYVFQYRLTPTKAGTITIPSAEIDVDGRTVRSQPVSLTAIEPESVAGFSLELDAPTEPVWAGEPVPITIHWSLAAPIENFRFTAPSLDDSIDVWAQPTQRRGSDTVPITIFNRQTVGRVRQVPRPGDSPRTVLDAELFFTPTEPGTFTIGPLSAHFEYVDARRRLARGVATSPARTIRVRPLPPGAPAAFTGLVGRVRLEAAAENDSVNVGDPIRLELTARVPEPSPEFTPPDLRSLPEFQDFRVSNEGWIVEPGSTPGARQFSLVLRATNADVDAIPAIPLAYFNPESGNYATAATKPIELTVRAVHRVTAADAVGFARTPGPVEHEHLTASGSGIWAPSLTPSTLVYEGFDLRRAITSPAGLALVLIPPGLVLTLISVRGITAKLTSGPATLRARRAAMRRLRAGDPTGALRTAVGVLTGRAPDAVTAADARTAPTSEHARRITAELLARVEAGTHGSTPPAQPLTAREVRDALQQLLAHAEAAR